MTSLSNACPARFTLRVSPARRHTDRDARHKRIQGKSMVVLLSVQTKMVRNQWECVNGHIPKACSDGLECRIDEVGPIGFHLILGDLVVLLHRGDARVALRPWLDDV